MTRKTIRRFAIALARWALATLAVSVLLLGSAGAPLSPFLLCYLGAFSGGLLAAMLVVDPDLAKERSRVFRPGQQTDRTAASFLFLSTLLTAALDSGRLHWLDSVPTHLRWSGLGLFLSGIALQVWAMKENPFFSPDVRLEAERGHRVIVRGPYRLVRHPGYLGMLVSVPASAPAIGSWLAMVPAAGFCLVILNRLGREEEFLEKNLAGYREYAECVRGRLIPRPPFRRPVEAHGPRGGLTQVLLLAFFLIVLNGTLSLLGGLASPEAPARPYTRLPLIPGVCTGVVDLELHRCAWRWP